MKKLKEYWMIIILLICFLGMGFYWYEWRPYKIRIQCAKETVESYESINSFGTPDQLKLYLDICLKKKGLEE
ncbi:MAG: hypothetical protein U9Q85_00395 [Patescibacteria group bacterium]|nr:hypothetical protein [Patescibacteria group bacterium]